ncbi:MAG: MBG domain-containing protein [Cyclobacteriaceae bacterium]
MRCGFLEKWEATGLKSPKLTAVINPGLGCGGLGTSISISADGNTVVAGSPTDNNNVGSAWVFRRINSTWNQQGTKLIGSNYVGQSGIPGQGPVGQGNSVSISADASTIAIGGPSDTGGYGAIWIFTNVNGIWTPGQKIAATTTTSGLGKSISLSADGSTLAAGSNGNNNNGGTRIFTRLGNSWNEQAVLIHSGDNDFSQGRSVSLSADGKSLAVGQYKYFDIVSGAGYGGVRLYYFDINSNTWKEFTGANFLTQSQPYDNPGEGAGKSVSLSANGHHLITGGLNEKGDQAILWEYSPTPPPSVVGFTPTISTSGLFVKIYGQNLGSTQKVKFIGIESQEVYVIGETEVQARLAPGVAGSGNVYISTYGGEVVVPGFTYVEKPVITNVSPLTGGPGTIVTITGNNLLHTSQVKLGGTLADFTIVDDHSVTIVVGSGSSGDVTLTTPAGSSIFGNFVFQTPAPVLSDFNPKSGKPGDIITLTGSNLQWINQVTFGGEAPNQSINVIDNNTITVVLSYGATGNVIVSSPGGQSSLSGFSFIPPLPSIATFSPSSGPVGTLVTIYGTNLFLVTSVKFGNTDALILRKTDSEILVMVMPGTNTGLVTAKISSISTTSNSSFSITNSLLPNSQEGNGLVPNDIVGAAQLGAAISISADGKTMAVSGNKDSSNKGAVWVYAKDVNNNWVQQGGKLTGTSTTSSQGNSIALSADGNTLVIGAAGYNSDKGIAWIFKRSMQTWALSKTLQSNINLGAPRFGAAVSISADGLTTAITGTGDNGGKGAIWIFDYTNNDWSEVAKLVPNSTIGTPYMGGSVSISANGNIVASGGDFDNSEVGAVWVFEKSNGVWNPTGIKIKGSDIVSNSYPHQGKSVAVNADGSTIAFGAHQDNVKGAVVVFTKQNNAWTQQGTKLTPTDWVTGTNVFGNSLSISADGNILAIGGPGDNLRGATWIFSRTGTTWSQAGTKIKGPLDGGQGNSVALSSDGNHLVFPSLSYNSYQGIVWSFVNQNFQPLTTPVLTFQDVVKSANDSPFTISCVSNSAGIISYSVVSGNDVISLTGNTVSINKSGSAVVMAAQDPSGNYTAATALATITVNKADQTISFNTIAIKKYGDVPFGLNATSNSNLPVSYVSSNTSVATVSGNQITITGAGVSTISASQPGDNKFNAATIVTQTLIVTKAPLTVLADDKTRAYGTSNPVFTATITGFVNGETISVLSGTPAFSTTALSTSSAGTYAITTDISQVSANNYSISAVNGTLYITTADQIISFDALPDKQYGLAPFNISATASSQLPITYSSTNTDVATIINNTVTITGAGKTTILASQSGNNNYNQATSVSQTLIVTKAPLTIRPDDKTRTYGTANQVFTTTITGFVNGETISVISGTPVLSTNALSNSKVGEYPIIADISQVSSMNYSISTIDGILHVIAADQTISFDALPDKQYGSAPFAISATASSQLPVMYSSSNTDVATISNNTITITGAGKTTILASQSGNNNYNSAEYFSAINRDESSLNDPS